MAFDEQRPDTDDYDLLTFGEVAARLAEELAAEAQELERLRSELRPDPAAIARVELRIERLQVVAGRYRQQEHTKEAFRRRFGPLQRLSADQRSWL